MGSSTFWMKIKEVGITVQDRLKKFAQVLVQYQSSLCCYVGCHCHVNILPATKFSSENFQDTHTTSTFGNIRVVTSEPGLVRSMYSSFTEVTRAVWHLIWLCTHFPHVVFIFSFAKLLCSAFFEMRAGSPRCICPCLPHPEPRMGSQTILVSITRTY